MLCRAFFLVHLLSRYLGIIHIVFPVYNGKNELIVTFILENMCMYTIYLTTF